MSPKYSAWAFSFLLWDVFGEWSTVPLATRLTPVIVKSSDGSLTLMWGKLLVIVSPRKGSGQCLGKLA